MKIKHYILGIGLLFLCSCAQSPENMLPHLNGYWEIEKVTFKDGTTKEFTINTQVDYVYIHNGVGLRKKVVPMFDGSFKSTDDQEMIEVDIANDSLHLLYKTPFDSWKETVLEANNEQLTVLTEDGNTYVYKRFDKITID